MVKKELKDIKHSNKVMNLLDSPRTYDELLRLSFLDLASLKKVLALLIKNEYIFKNSRDLWEKRD